MSGILKRTLTGGAVAACAAGMLMVPASTASAHDGTPPNACKFDKRANTKWARGCFEWKGDDHWLQDRRSDGHSVRMHVMTDYGKHRRFTNTHGAPKWHEKKLDHWESACVRWRVIKLKSGTNDRGPWSHWYKIKNGNRC